MSSRPDTPYDPEHERHAFAAVVERDPRDARRELCEDLAGYPGGGKDGRHREA